jgi:hypothetical protein
MFYGWAYTGLSFDSSAKNEMVQAMNINSFLKKQCGVQVHEYCEDLITLSEIWKEAKMKANAELLKA